MATSHKAHSFMRAIKEELEFRIPATGRKFNLGVDSSGNPTLSINDGTAATGEKNLVVIVKSLSNGVTDSLGLASNEYGPHVVQISTETGATANAHFWASDELAFIMSACMKPNAVFEWYRTANTTVPTTSALGTLAVRIADLWKGSPGAS